MRVAVVDYGLGNIYSVMAALQAVGSSPILDIDGTLIPSCDLALVPGVAAFGVGMRKLHESGQAAALLDHFNAGKKLVGLCLGAQMFLQGSEESPEILGLGLISGKVIRLDDRKCTVPNQGWLQVTRDDAIHQGSLLARSGRDYFYFSHSYRMVVEPGVNVLGTSNAGTERIVAIYERDNVIGVQFHPERSGARGLEFLSAVITS